MMTYGAVHKAAQLRMVPPGKLNHVGVGRRVGVAVRAGPHLEEGETAQGDEAWLRMVPPGELALEVAGGVAPLERHGHAAVLLAVAAQLMQVEIKPGILLHAHAWRADQPCVHRKSPWRDDRHLQRCRTWKAADQHPHFTFAASVAQVLQLAIGCNKMHSWRVRLEGKQQG